MVGLKFKVCRRLGENVWQKKKLTPKQSNIIRLVIKKNTSGKQSDFYRKLQQMKKLAYFYGMRSLNNHSASIQAFQRLDKKKSLLLTLEARLDVILVRLCFCSTLFMARQLITHKKIRVNSNVVNIPGFTVRNGDIISILPSYLDLVKSKIKQSLCATMPRSHIPPENVRFEPANLSEKSTDCTFRASPNYAPQLRIEPSYHLEVNYKTFNAVFLYEPNQIHFPYKIDLDFLF